MHVISKRFKFEAAHRLPVVPDGHQCGRVHGHSYVVEVRVAGELDEHLGWVMDFSDLTAAVRPLVDEQLDHRLLNDVPGLSNPTSERLAEWLWERLAGDVPGLALVAVEETASSRSEYVGGSGA